MTTTTARTATIRRSASFALLVALALFAAIASNRSFAAAPPKPLSFLVIGDWGRDGKHLQREVADQMAKTAAQHDARFVLTTGDNFYNNGVPSVDAPAWRTSFEDVYTHAALQIPWYVVLGNHDYRGNSQAQIDYTQKSKRWRMPARYFKVEQELPGGGRAEFYFLDTCPMVERYRLWKSEIGKQDANAQLRWLDENLASSKADWRVVVGHHPVFSEGSLHGDTPELVKRLKPMLDRHKVQLYLNGHDHDLQHIVVDSVNYITSGAGSKTRSTGKGPNTRFGLGHTSGFVAVSLTRDSLTARFIDWQGNERYAFGQGR